MIKPCSVIYNPGAGGNFICRCLSLSKETVPYFSADLKTLTDQQLALVKAMTADQRKKILHIDSLQTFTTVHGRSGEKKIFQPDFYYENQLVNENYEWAVVTNHCDNYHDRLPWLKKIIYLDIELERYKTWTNKAGQYFKQFGFTSNFACDFKNLDANMQQIKNNAITVVLDMNAVLANENGFTTQYLLACSELSITPETEHALDLYRGWKKFRVDPFL